ncbi:hypothetical protein [Gillisia sp. CAL575]|uniref:hypothetical protein n=1 Tax=Gillisia sp. CAL575 TaxID=985255 RepID=UPI00039E14A7|nr:hypothetical protein [Gillisia sp. CAL575]
MHDFRLLAVLLILVFTNAAQAFSINEVSQGLGVEVSISLSEDHIDLSTPFPTTACNNFYNHISFPSGYIPTESDLRILTKSEKYYINSRFIKPGLSIPDIIFPFHTFL